MDVEIAFWDERLSTVAVTRTMIEADISRAKQKQAVDKMAAAYILGPERGSLSPQVLERCDFTVKIPTKFCVNVGTAGAIVMYDRILSLGRFARRPVNPRGEGEAMPEHVRGPQVIRRERKLP